MRSQDEIRANLRGRLDALRARQAKVTRDLQREGDPDSQERAIERENDEVLEDLDDQALEEMGQLSRALARLDAGTYGVCEGCGEEIPGARLEAIPWATHCVDCAD